MADLLERTYALVALQPGDTTAPPPGRFTEQNGLLLARTAPHHLIAMREGEHTDLMEELTHLFPNTPLIDWSDARISTRLSGPGTADRLTRLLPLDLHLFHPGHCTQTLAAHLTITLLQHAPEDYELQCGRSFQQTFQSALNHLDPH